VNFDVWTVFLEIVNFLILVWILKRFLYKPVLDVIARRRAGVEKVLSDAQTMRKEAERLKEEYEGRVAAWPKEREREEAALREELQAERQRQIETLRVTLAGEQKKHEVLEERRLQEQRKRLEQAAADLGARFAARLLSAVASPEVEARLIDFFLEELGRQSPERRQALGRAIEESPGPVRIISAYPIPPDRRARLTKGLADFFGRKVACEFSEKKELLAGVRVAIGPWTMQADLAGELKLFRDAAEGPG
jgi:F-type H+-transporting ATPase subunit b